MVGMSKRQREGDISTKSKHFLNAKERGSLHSEHFHTHLPIFSEHLLRDRETIKHCFCFLESHIPITTVRILKNKLRVESIKD